MQSTKKVSPGVLTRLRGHRVLITGGTGLLGKALIETAPAGWELVATYCHNEPPAAWRELFHRLDVRDPVAVEQLIAAVRPRMIIHAASIGGVDEAERHPERVHAVNVQGTQAVGRACVRVGASLLFISSNAVFDGCAGPYDEEAPVRAVNRYGALKIEAETWVRRCPIHWAIVRPILMYGWPLPGSRTNVVTRWLAQFEEGRLVEVDTDLYSTPLLASNCAEMIWACVVRERTGIYHAAGPDRLSLLAFAHQVAQVFGFEPALAQPASAASLSQFAPRPRDTSLVTSKVERELGVRPIGTAEGLAIMRRTQAAAPQRLQRCES